MYGLEIVALTKRKELELKILLFSSGTTLDKIRNEYIRETAQVEEFGNNVREASLRRCGCLHL